MAQDRVEAVERALNVLEVFDSHQERFTLAELAHATGYYKSTLLRLLGSLARFDYVQRGEDGRWELGVTPARLARRHSPERLLSARMQPVLDRLAIDSGETAALLEGHGQRVECRLVALPASSLYHDLQPGADWPVASADDPRPAIEGGVMLCRVVPPGAAPQPLWLTLSGPAGRLDRRLGEALLAQALDALGLPGKETAQAYPESGVT